MSPPAVYLLALIHPSAWKRNSQKFGLLRDEVTYLWDENRRKDEIIMDQAMTMRQLTAAPQQEVVR
jgi:hypothetical protein